MRFVIEVELGENNGGFAFDESEGCWVKDPAVQFNYLKTIEGYLNTLMEPLLTGSIPGKIVSIESKQTIIHRSSDIDFMAFD